MPILPPDAMAPPPQTNILYMSPRQVAEADYATQMRYAEAQRIAAQQAQDEAEGRVRDQQFHEALLQNARTEGAGKALNTALRFQGMRGFERDRSAGKAAGLSDEQATLQALQKNAGRMFLDSPGDIAPSVRMLQPPVTVPARGGVPAHLQMGGRPWFPPANATAVEFPPRVETIDGVKVLRTGPQRSQALPNTNPKYNERLSNIRLRADILKDQLNTLNLTPDQSKAIREQLQKVSQEAVDLDAGPTSAQPQVDGTFPVEAPTAPAVPSPAAGATPLPAPAAAKPKGWVIVRRKSDKAEFRLPRSEWEESGGDSRYELVNRR